jgi:hypothetical protein
MRTALARRTRLAGSQPIIYESNMGQRGNPHRWRTLDPPLWARRPAPRQKRFYDLEVLPKYALRAAQAKAADFAAKSKDEQRAIVTRLTVERVRAMARRKGKPEPIITEVTVKPLPGGGCVGVEGTERPLRPEFGGDGRTLEDALRGAKSAKPKDYVHIASLQLAIIAEKHRKRLEALGYTIVMVEAGVEINRPHNQSARSAQAKPGSRQGARCSPPTKPPRS